MAKNKNSKATRPIRFDQFNEQLEEAGIENLQEVQLNKEDSIWIRLGNSIDQEDTEDFEQRLAEAEDSEAAAVVVLDYYPPTSDPDEYEPGERGRKQFDLFQELGGEKATADRLMTLFANASRDQVDRLGKIRPRRS